ncbi:MAG: arginine repressor [Pyrinomonadaceae bacterium]
MRKRERHNALLELIANEPIGNQSLLASRLSTAGFTVTQTSVSRDLVELGIVKANGAYSLPRRKVEPMGDLGAVTFDTAGECLIVGRCASGLASAITVRIDADKIGEIVGTIAGDDTIFIAVKNSDDQAVVLRLLGEKFGQHGVSI